MPLKKPELVCPAGGMEKLKTVLRYGADAVYLGGKMFNLRAQSSNFSMDALKEAVFLTHKVGKKVFVTLNIIARNHELTEMSETINVLNELKVDAVIVADLGVFELVKENSPLDVHISTQASTANWRAVRMWEKLGAKRVILAREVPLDDLKEIRNKAPNVELEVFIHGAMCMAYSGRCQLSSYLTGRDSNRGACAHCCRYKYALVEEKRPGEFYPVYEDSTGSYIYNSKDLCTIHFLDKIIETGVDGLKIEGRMKGLLYGATTTKIYREAIEAYFDGRFQLNPTWKTELETFSNRTYCSGFYLGEMNKESERRESSGYVKTHEFVAKVLESLGHNKYLLQIRNKLMAGNNIELLQPKGPVQEFVMPVMKDHGTEKDVTIGNPNAIVIAQISMTMEPGDLLRQKIRN